MELYSQCSLVLMNSESIDLEVLPYRIKEDIKQMKVLYGKLKERVTSFDAYYNTLAVLGEIAWDTLTCDDCEHQNPWPADPTHRCEFHSTLIDWLIEEQKELKEKLDIVEYSYHSERETIKNFPHLLGLY